VISRKKQDTGNSVPAIPEMEQKGMHFHLKIGGKWIASQSKDGVYLSCFPKINAAFVGRSGGNVDSQDTAAPIAVPVPDEYNDLRMRGSSSGAKVIRYYQVTSAKPAQSQRAKRGN
jgi:hypothetical protein